MNSSPNCFYLFCQYNTIKMHFYPMKELICLVALLTHACFPQTMLVLLVSQWDFVDTSKNIGFSQLCPLKTQNKGRMCFFPSNLGICLLEKEHIFELDQLSLCTSSSRPEG